MTPSPLLQASGLSKSFGGARALRAVDFELQAGVVHALVGENGAGKSTLIKIITGAVTPDEGRLLIAGETVVDNSPARAKALGVAAIYQQPALFPDLTVAENIALGLEKRGAWRWIDWPARRRRSAELLDRIGAKISPTALAGRLSMPQQQLVEIARALGANARIVIMDEPTASLSEREVEHLFAVIRQLRASGVGIIYVSHRLEELAQVADRVTAMRDGAIVGTRAMRDVTSAELIRMMVGRELSAVFPKVAVASGAVILETKSLTCETAGVFDISLQVRAGEILGLAGLVGAGRTQLAETLFGITPAERGQILIGGRPVSVGSPREAVAMGLAYLPEDRRRHGVVLEMSVAANASLAAPDTVSTLGWLSRLREHGLAQSFVERLGIKTSSVAAPVESLSGGNQQKVALARWLATKPAALILDEPTQGVDVGAKAEIHRLMGELTQQGLAIVMISSELLEILGMSDRIAVLQAGRIVATLSRDEATAERVMALALRHDEGASAA